MRPDHVSSRTRKFEEGNERKERFKAVNGGEIFGRRTFGKEFRMGRRRCCFAYCLLVIFRRTFEEEFKKLLKLRTVFLDLEIASF